MYRTVALVFFYHVLSQPVTDEPSTRHVRQVIECCPCPSQDGAEDVAGSGQVARAGGVDDCTCWPRGADSDGASSLFFPSAVRADGPHLRPKEDPKNLLEPEVALATSMLDTLREATEEEYQEALARDAARSAAEPDAVPEESARNVVIIVNPRDSDNDDDFISQASHVQEPRCIQPLGSTSLGKMRFSSKPIDLLPDTLKFPILKRPSLLHSNPQNEDSHLGASTVEETFVDLNGNSQKLKSRTPMIKLNNSLKSTLKNHNNALRFEKPKLNFSKLDENEPNVVHSLKFPFKTISKSQTSLTNNDRGAETSCEQLPKEANDKNSLIFRHAKLPLNLRNLLKLRDVELIPKTVSNKALKKPLDISKFAIPTLFKNNKKENVLKDNSNENTLSDNNLDIIQSIQTPNTLPNEISESKSSELNINTFDNYCENELIKDKQENLDALSSPSQVQMSIVTVGDETSDVKSSENVPNFDCVESEELSNMNSQLKIAQDKLEDFVPKTVDPELITVLAENNSSEDSVQNFEDDEILKDQALNGDTDTNTSNNNILNLMLLENQERNIDTMPEMKAEKDNNEDNVQNFDVKDILEDQALSEDSETISSNNKLNLVPLNNQERAIDTTPAMKTENYNNEDNVQSIDIEDVLQDQALNEDNETNSSNNIFNLVPLENQERAMDIAPQILESIKSSYNQANDDSCDVEDEITTPNLKKTNKSNKSKLDKVPPLRETMSILRENVIKKFDNLKKPPIKLGLSKTLSDNVGEEGDGNIIKSNLNQYFESDSLKTQTIDSTDLDFINSETKQIKNAISMDDIQDMSDKLLNSNSNSQNNTKLLKKAESKIKNNNLVRKSNESNNENIIEIFETVSDDPFNSEKDRVIETHSRNAEGDACPSNIESRNTHGNSKVQSQSTEPNEMDTGASDTIINTLPGIFDSFNSNLKLRTPLLDDIILQPPSNSLNLLGKPLENVLNFNTNFPTLDDLRERLANIFNANDRSAETDSCSLESDSNINSSIEGMAPEASMTNSHNELPFLKPFENFNVDIFRNKPLVRTPSKTLTKIPKYNLNTFRSKIPAPSKLDLKPIKLEKKLGNNAGLESLLNLGSDRTSTRYAKTRNFMDDSLDHLPKLEKLRYKLRPNTDNLLNRPIDPNLNLFSESLRSDDIQDIAENIRLNTQKTIKGLQHKMKSTLRKAKIQTPLGDPFAKPKEMIDDMNDKLKAIQYDLNDRLSSIHENIIDSSRIKSFVDQPLKAGNRNVMTNFRQNKPRRPSSRLQPAASTITTQNIDPNERNGKQRDFTFDSKPINFINKDWKKSHKTQTVAESALTPVRGDIPKSLNPSLSYLPRTYSIRQNPNINRLLKEEKPLSTEYEANKKLTKLRDSNTHIFRTAESPFSYKGQPNKVTISFGTTTAKPIASPQPFIKVPGFSPSKSEEYNPFISTNLNGKPNKNEPVLNHKVQPPKNTPANFKPLRNLGLVPNFYDEEFEDSFNNFSNEKSVIANSNIKPSLLRETSNSEIHKIYGNGNRFKSTNVFENKEEKQEILTSKSSAKPSFDWPKSTQNSFLSKVKDAIQTRKSENLQADDVQAMQAEMLKSPSENKDIIFDEPLKENVSYRCRMVCTKEIK